MQVIDDYSGIVARKIRKVEKKSRKVGYIMPRKAVQAAVMQASKHQAAAFSGGLSIMYMITDGMQPKRQGDRAVHLLAAAVEQTMRTTSPSSSDSRHIWRMGQPRQQPGHLWQVQGAALEGRPDHRTV